MQGAARQRILLVLFGGLLLTAAWRYLLLNRETSRKADVSPRPAMAPPRSSDRLVPLHLEKLDEARPPAVAGRNLWRFVDPPLRRPATRMIAASPAIHPPADPPPQVVPGPPELTMEYLGNFGPPEKKLAVFRDGRRIRNALQGDILDGKLRVGRIGRESVEIEFLGFPGSALKILTLHARVR